VRKLLRWLTAATLPVTVAALMSVAGSAGTGGQQLIAHDNIAYTHCTSGANQDGNQQSNCFATPYAYTNEPGWWWRYGISESWYNYNGAWITNTGDWIPPSPFSNWIQVEGP
jgi:hypothetical protein